MDIKKKILFVAPDYYGFHDVIFDALKKYSGHEVTMVISNPIYKYKNAGEKITNFFMKTFLKKNLKTINNQKNLLSLLQSNSDIDLAIINRPDILTDEQLKIVTGNAKRSAAIYWDSFAKIPQEHTLHFFDKAFSFDETDCKRYHMVKNNNFYFVTEKKDHEKWDIFFIGTYDKRFPDLVKILSYLKENFSHLKVKSQIYSYHTQEIPDDLKENIILTNKIVPFNEAYVYNQDTKVILDLAHRHQKGLSFRPFEAMGLRKKLITNNPDIVNYDFYNPNNILVIDMDTINIPKGFFETPYEDLPEDIYKKYSIESWVDHIIEESYE